MEALTTEKTELNNKITGLATDKENLTKDKENLTKDKAELQKRVKELEQSQQALKNGNDELLKDREKLTTQNTELAEKIEVLTTEKTELNNKITGSSTEKDKLTRERDKLTTEKEKLNTDLSTAKTQAEQTSQKLNELERRHAPYQKLEKLYEVFLEVKDRLNFNFVATTHSAMDLIASVLSDSKYYLESLYNKASQELSDKRSDKGEKLAELFDLLFEYIKDNKFERLKEPSAYDHSCKKLYPEQNTSQKMRRVVLRGYTYDKKIACYTIVDMGS
ncbi:M protein [Helicobacter pylori]